MRPAVTTLAFSIMWGTMDKTVLRFTASGLRGIALAGLLALAGCMSSGSDKPSAGSGPLGDVTNAPAGAGVNVAAGSPEDFIVNVGRRIFFSQGSAELDDVARETLNNQAAWLNSYTQYPVKLDGFADDPGSAQANMQLGFRRAEAAKAYLVSMGIDAGRIRVRSSGNERPTMRCGDISCKAQNRHVRTVLDPPTRGGQQQVADAAPVSAIPAVAQPSSGTTVALGSSTTLTVRGRVRAEGAVTR